MRPPALLVPGDDLAGAGGIIRSRSTWRQQYEALSFVLETEGYDGLKALQDDEESLWAVGAGTVNSYAGNPPALETLRDLHSQDVTPAVLAAALRGHAASEPPSAGFKSLREARTADMAADAYGVPQVLSCPVLILAMPGDPAHPVEAAASLAEMLPDSELVVAAGPEEARATWSKRIDTFFREAWMKEFLTKRVMPQ